MLVTVTDPDGAAAADVGILVFKADLSSATWSARATTGPDGVAVFRNMPEAVHVSVSAPLGDGYGQGDAGNFFSRGNVTVAQTGSTTFPVTLPYTPAMAVFPASVAASSLNADRSELDLHLTLAFPSGVNVTDYTLYPCTVTCIARRVNADGTHAEIQVRQQQAPDRNRIRIPAPVTVAPGAPYSALLLLDQGRRMADEDLAQWRLPAARRFIRRARETDRIAVGGFAGSDAALNLPPLLPQLPLWLAAPFGTDRPALEAAAAALTPMVGGASPVLNALHAATDEIAQLAPTGRRALVALVGGDDDSGLDDPQWLTQAMSLRQKQASLDIHSILVPADSRFYWSSSSRDANNNLTTTVHPNKWQLDQLARLAAILDAPLIYSLGSYGKAAGLKVGQLDMAAHLLASQVLRHEIDIHVTATSPGAFASGSTLLLPINIYNGVWDGYWDRDFYAVAKIP
ncbi:MAG: carboxypeptidase-like regulatory domain-containing protein [Steroidobacteraceae bacterium]